MCLNKVDTISKFHCMRLPCLNSAYLASTLSNWSWGVVNKGLLCTFAVDRLIPHSIDMKSRTARKHTVAFTSAICLLNSYTVYARISAAARDSDFTTTLSTDRKVTILI
jgi:hypothetical protein